MIQRKSQKNKRKYTYIYSNYAEREKKKQQFSDKLIIINNDEPEISS